MNQTTTPRHSARLLEAATRLEDLIDENHAGTAAQLAEELHALLQEEFLAATPSRFAPWVLRDYSEYTIKNRQLYYHGGLSVTTFAGCKLEIQISGHSMTPVQAYGTAHLVKAAPDLLHALEDLIRDHTPEHVAAAELAIRQGAGASTMTLPGP